MMDDYIRRGNDCVPIFVFSPTPDDDDDDDGAHLGQELGRRKTGETCTSRTVDFSFFLQLYPPLDTLKDEDGDEPDSLATTSDAERCRGSEQLLWFRLKLE